MNAIVTGGCSGLGKCFTEELLKKGYKVYALYNNSVDSALELENTYDNIRCIKCDIRKEEEIEQVFFNLDDIDLLINNAAISKDNSYLDKTKKEFMTVLETNLVGTFLVIKNAIGKLNKNGIIVNISSNNALDNYSPLSMDYDASKAGVNMLTKDFALVMKDKRIVSICPGWIRTEAVKCMNQDYLKSEMIKVNQKKIIDPYDLAKHIIEQVKDYKNGEIVEIKEL